MNPRTIVAVAALVLGATGCSSPDAAPADEPTWVGTTTTEGDVTTVVNESGSVWGGVAQLIEEASIGVDAGEDPYMLGRVPGIAAGNDRIYIVDDQVPAVRVYDWQGVWLHDLGGEGQGPGEFQAPSGVAVDAEGRVWVHEQVMTRLMVFAPEGEVLATHNVGGARISGSASSMTMTDDGRAYVVDVLRPDDPTAADDRRIVMKPVDFEGNVGAPVDVPEFDNPASVEARSDNAVRFAAVPFHPNGVTAFSSAGVTLSGYPDEYRFERLHPDGRRTIVRRTWEPVPVLPDEAEAHRRAVTAYMRDMDPSWSWDAQEIPQTKSAFTRLLPAISGETWVVRPGPGRRIPDCDPQDFDLSSNPPCWEEERIIDVFGADGRYLGQVEAPEGFAVTRPQPFIRGTDIIAKVEDDAGTIMVKRYRLVPPDRQ